ncbi:MAG: YCF48-related protein, partial [Candidatus Zixiibacteriota bacterium]
MSCLQGPHSLLTTCCRLFGLGCLVAVSGCGGDGPTNPTTELQSTGWHSQNPYPTHQPLSSVYFVDDEFGWAVGEFGAAIHSEDGGNTWTVQTTGTSQNLWKVQFLNRADGWAVGDSGTVIETNDGGRTWDNVQSGTDRPLYDLAFLDSKNGWIVRGDSILLHTSDGGSFDSIRTGAG